jgi:hypothetical protein
MKPSVRRLEEAGIQSTPELAEQETKDMVALAKRLGVVEELERLIGATEELFPGKLEIHVENDFDEPYEPFFEFGVQASGTIPDIIERDRKWHERLVAIAPGYLRLFSIDIHVDFLNEDVKENGRE